ncbi:hypothetical protein ACTXT7_001021 [Hymenolepis weldensis]
MTLGPVDGVFQLVERSPRGLRGSLWNMQRRLFSLEPITMVDAVVSNMMREVGPDQNRGTSSPDVPRDVFEVGDDGKLNFRVYFNAKDYRPEDITIQTGREKLTIKAKKSVKEGSTTVEEFVGKSIALPPSVDSEKLKATLTKDDILVVEAPVNEPEYRSIEVKAEEGLTIQPAQVEENQLALNNKDGLEIATSEDGSKRMHLELVVGEHFSPDDLKIWTKDGRMFVSGAVTKEEKTENSLRSERYEFRRSFPVPENVDVEKLKAEIAGGHLVVEAPINS